MSRNVLRLAPVASGPAHAVAQVRWLQATALAAALLTAACNGGGGGSGGGGTLGTACDGAFVSGSTKVVTDAAAIEFIPLVAPGSSTDDWMVYNLDAECRTARLDHLSSSSFKSYTADLSTRPPRVVSENSVHDQLKALAGQYGFWEGVEDRNIHGDIVGSYYVEAGTPYGGFFLYDGGSGQLFPSTLGNGAVDHTMVNSSRAIAGNYTVAGGARHGFVQSGGTLTVLDYPESLVPTVIWGKYAVATHVINGTWVTGLNDAGKVVGWADLDLTGPYFVAPGYHQPFVYDTVDGTWSNFQFDPNASPADVTGIAIVTPEGITNSGDVYGEYLHGAEWSAFYQFAATGKVARFNPPDGGFTSLVAGHADRVVLGHYLAGSDSTLKSFMARITAR